MSVTEGISINTKLLAACLLYPHVQHDSKRACDLAEEFAWILEHREDLEPWAHDNIRIEKPFAEGVKHLTGIPHASHARERFESLLKKIRLRTLRTAVYHPLAGYVYISRGLTHWEESGFTREEMELLEKIFKNHLANPVAGTTPKAAKRSGKSGGPNKPNSGSDGVKRRGLAAKRRR